MKNTGEHARYDLREGLRGRFGLSPTFVIFMTIFIDLTGFGMIIPLLPFYALTFQAEASGIGILVASFSIMQFIFAPLLGRSSDNFGRRPILLLSILISCLSFILFSYANSFLMLLFSRIIAGMATETAVAQAYIADITGEDERARGIGRIGAAFGAGIIVGPAIGGFLSVYGFWAPGLAATALTLVNYFFVLFFLPESVVHKNPRTQTPDSDGGYLSKWGEAFRKPIIGSVLIIFFIIVLAFSTIPVTLPLLGIKYFNLKAVEMSYIFMYIGVIQIILQGFLIGRLTDKVGEERLIVYGSLLMTAGMFVIPLVSEFMVFLASMTVISLGIGIMHTAIPSFISKRTSEREQGTMLGITQSTASIARVPGPLIGGFVFEYVGVAAPFFLSATLLTGACGLGCRVFQKCVHRRPKNT